MAKGKSNRGIANLALLGEARVEKHSRGSSRARHHPSPTAHRASWPWLYLPRDAAAYGPLDPSAISVPPPGGLCTERPSTAAIDPPCRAGPSRAGQRPATSIRPDLPSALRRVGRTSPKPLALLCFDHVGRAFRDHELGGPRRRPDCASPARRRRPSLHAARARIPAPSPPRATRGGSVPSSPHSSRARGAWSRVRRGAHLPVVVDLPLASFSVTTVGPMRCCAPSSIADPPRRARVGGRDYAGTGRAPSRSAGP